MNEQRILLMYANPYDMKNEQGETVKGCVLNYYFAGENCEFLKTKQGLYDAIGYQRAKNSIDFDHRQHIPAAPAYYDATLEMTVGSDGKAVSKVVDLKYVADAVFLMKAPAK